MARLSFDIGGTFTDLVLSNPAAGQTIYHKVSTTPDDLMRGVLDGISELFGKAHGIALDHVGTVLHATTVATNAILERRGSATALITTRGFRDVLIIGRQKRYNTFDLYLDKPAPLIPRRCIFEVEERVSYEGKILKPLDLQSVDRAVEAIAKSGAESVAVALLHSYANPEHELLILKRLRDLLPGIETTLSSDVSPKYREYERTSTTVANAYVKPLVAQYVQRLEGGLAENGLSGDVYIMQSNGGLVTPSLAREYPVRIVESGPAAGVLMCASVGCQEGHRYILTFDMGGTTAKLGAVDEGAPVITPTFEVDNKHFRKFSGLPLNVPAIELLEIGAGGGSIACVDMGLIRVGPTSAGAVPGPACYRRGGSEPTVTDANLILGYLNPAYFNGGAMELDADAAAASIERAIAAPLGVSVGEAAWGIHAVANSSMETAMRVISVERGRDPRQYALIAFGGAGPLHAARLARALGVPKLIVPKGAGVGSAVGLLSADSRVDVSTTRIMKLNADSAGVLARIYGGLAERARQEYRQLNLTRAPKWERHAYLRHAGQGFEIRVDLPAGDIDAAYIKTIVEAFYASYEKAYGYRDPDAVVEGVDWQLVATLKNETPAHVASQRSSNGDPTVPNHPRRKVYFPETNGFTDCQVIDRYRMRSGVRIVGPAIVEEAESTTVVLPGDLVEVTTGENLLITIAAGAGQ